MGAPRRGEDASDGDPVDAGASGDTSSGGSGRRRTRRAEPKVALPALHEAVGQLRERIQGIQLAMSRLPSRVAARTELLRTILATRIASRLDRVAERLGVGRPASARALDSRTTQRAIEQLREIDLHLYVLKHLIAWRTDPALGASLEDADTIARALLRPIQQLAATEELGFPQLDVVCAPAAPDEESVWFTLLPPGHPVVFVPEEFGKDSHRWVSVPHEIGHLIWRGLPGFETEVRQRLGLGAAGLLMRRDENGYVFDIGAPFASWIEEIHCDGITALMMGPTALRGFVACFSKPDDATGVLWAYPGEHGRYGDHPPAHLRIHLMSALLETVGFDVEAKRMLREWSDLHGSPESLLFPTRDRQAVRVPAAPVIERGVAYIREWYQGGYASLAGRELRDVHGFEMSPAMWAQAQRARDDLLRGVSAVRDPRLVLAGAIEAIHARPSAAQNVAKNLLASIVSPGERRVSSAAKATQRGQRARPAARREKRALLDKTALRDAVVFGEIFAPPRAGVLPARRTDRSARG